MHIDAHQHFWVYDPREYGWIDDSMAVLRRDFLPHDLKPELDRAGFQGSVAVQARQTIEETRWLLELAASSPVVLGVVGWVDLQSPDVRSQLQAFAQNPKLVGIRHIVQGEPDDRFLLRPDFMRGMAVLEEFDLAYDILIYTKHLKVAAEFVRQFPRQRFVLDHLAKPPIKRWEPAALDARDSGTGDASQCHVQVVWDGDGSRLAALEVRTHDALFRRCFQMLWTATSHDRIGLAGVCCGCALFSRHECGERLSGSLLDSRPGGCAGRQCAAILEVEAAAVADGRFMN